MKLPIHLSKCLLCGDGLKDRFCYSCHRFSFDSSNIYLSKNFSTTMSDFNYYIIRYSGCVYDRDHNFVCDINLLDDFANIFTYIDKITVFK